MKARELLLALLLSLDASGTVSPSLDGQRGTRLGQRGALEAVEVDDADGERIVSRSAGILGVGIQPDGAAEIARRSRGTPRIANRLLRRVRDFAQVKADGIITGQVATDEGAPERG